MTHSYSSMTRVLLIQHSGQGIGISICLGFPAFKSDGRNSPFYVHLSDVAFWLDSMQKDSKRDWQAMNE